MEPEQEFLPKDREGALRVLAEKMYARIDVQRAYATITKLSIAERREVEDDIRWIKQQLELIERS